MLREAWDIGLGISVSRSLGHSQLQISPTSRGKTLTNWVPARTTCEGREIMGNNLMYLEAQMAIQCHTMVMPVYIYKAHLLKPKDLITNDKHSLIHSLNLSFTTLHNLNNAFPRALRPYLCRQELEGKPDRMLTQSQCLF